MRSNRFPWAWCWLIAAAWLAGRSLHLPVLQAAAGMALVNLLPGLALLRVIGFSGRGLAWVLLGAGTLSAPLVAAVGLVTGLAHGSIETSALFLIAASLVVLTVPARATGEAAQPEWTRSEPQDRTVLLMGAVLALIVALGLLNPRLARWSDSWFHAAVFQEILRAGVPVAFPHFADGPLPYPWFFHVYLVAVRGIVHPDPFQIMATLNIWTSFLWGAAVYSVARAAGLNARAAVASALVAFLGVNPAGSLLFLAQGVVGETAGFDALRHMIADSDHVLIALQWHFPTFQATWLGRLWTPTAFNFALALTAFLVSLAFELWRAPSWRVTLLFAATLALLVHWHTLTALSLAIGLAVGACLAAVPRLRDDARGALGALARLGGSMVAAFAIGVPYLKLVTVGGDNKVMILKLSSLNLGGLVISMGAVLAGALWAQGRLPARARGLWNGLVVGFVLPLLFFDLPGIAEEKLYYPMFLVVAAVAGLAFDALWRARGIPRAVAAVFVAGGLLTAAITAVGFLGDRRPMRDMIDAPHVSRAEFYTPDEAAALRWIRERSPREAVFVQPLRPQGTEPINVHGGRRLFLGPAEMFYRVTFFETPGRPPIPIDLWNEVMRRDTVQRVAFSTRALSDAQLEYLRTRPWPVYFWWDSSMAGGELSPTLRDTSVARMAFETPGVRILELRRPALPRSGSDRPATVGRATAR